MSDYTLTPTAELEDGETVIRSFSADRATYRRDMAWMAAWRWTVPFFDR